ncbi:AlpA family phage regulatory protein [Pseudoalteromonas maricaloris]|uniref:AlpA family phage regulatory protein n=1 Tax=Pseudoalteromonas maricaloris TaxID=184924 RepID=UPI00029A9F9C
MPTNSVYPARQQRILRLPEVKAKTGFGRSPFMFFTYLRDTCREFPRYIRIGVRRSCNFSRGNAITLRSNFMLVYKY